MRLIQRTNKKKRGAALVEYGLLIAGVALVCAVGISMFGKKTNAMIGTAAAVLPSNDTNDLAPIKGGQLIRTTNDGGVITLDAAAVTTDANGTEAIFGTGAGALISD